MPRWNAPSGARLRPFHPVDGGPRALRVARMDFAARITRTPHPTDPARGARAAALLPGLAPPVAALVTAIRAWLPLVARDVPGFDASSFADKPDVPDDVLEDGERLLSVVDEHVDGSGAPLAYRPGAVAALGAALAAAQKEWAEADEADATYQKMLKEVRTTAAVFDAELQAFRRTLSTVFGRSSKDFQKLRVERASHADEEDDGGAPPPAQH